MDINKVLRIIRNPHGLNDHVVRDARLAAADEIARLRAENEALRDELDSHKCDWSRFHHLMAAQGWHPGRTDDDLIDILRDKLSGMWSVIEQILRSGHMNTEDLARLRAVFAPQKGDK